jgi:putative transposase
MARLPRFDLPGIAQHVVQRGNNRLPCFLDDQDRWTYLTLLGEALESRDCALHAYVLMDNHVHLLLTPECSGELPKLMHRISRRYTGFFNARHERTGTLWEGRYRACLVDSDDYLLRCTRYIDLNPVRARLVDDPVEYRWSSCAALCGLRPDPLIRAHPTMDALGTDVVSRGAAYRALLDRAVPAGEVEAIRTYLRQQRAWGRDAFQAMVEAKTRRFARARPPHRPARTGKCT